MATGMVSSAHALQNTAPVLRAGERMASSPRALADKNSRVFHHMVPGARFVMPDGLEIVFLGGQFVTNDPEIIAELDKVSNKSSSMIYTAAEVVESVKANANKLAADAADTAGKA